MTASNLSTALALVLAHEGGLVDNPADPGGRTNKGITQAVYDAYRTNRWLPKQDVAKIADSEVSDIYGNQYWARVKGDQLPSGLDYAVFDYAVNSGVNRAIQDLQRTVNAATPGTGQLAVDGELGEASLAAVMAACAGGDASLILAYCERRMEFLKSLKNFRTFGKGWTRRVEGDVDGAQDSDVGVVDYACKMAKQSGLFDQHTVDLPTAIGDKPGETAAKALPGHVAFFKTLEGYATALAGSGVTGQVAIQTAQQVKPQIGQGPLGQLALYAFVALIAAGALLWALNWLHQQDELKAKAA